MLITGAETPLKVIPAGDHGPFQPPDHGDLQAHVQRCDALLQDGLEGELLVAAGAFARAARDQQDDAQETRALSLLAHAAQRCGRFSIAVQAQGREAELRARGGDRVMQAYCLNNIGLLWANLGAYADALASLHACQQLGEQYTEIPDELRAACSVNLGHVFLNMGQPAQALNFLDSGLTQARRCGDLETEVGALGMIGLAHKDLAHHAQSTETLLHAIELARHHDLKPQLIDLHDNLGQVHLERGELEEAAGMFGQSLFWAEEAQDVQGRVNALLGLGRLKFRSSQPGLAHSGLLAALELAGAHELRPSKLSILEALFGGLEGQGRLADAYPFLREYRALERELFTEETERKTQSMTDHFEAERARRETETYRQLGEVAQHARLQAEETVRVRTAELEAVQIEIVTRLGMAAEYRDDKTGQHTRRVGELSAHLAQAMGLPPEEVDLIRWAARLHDIGKIGVGDDVLLKAGQYTPAEFERMKLHTEIGAKVLEGSTSRLLRMAEDIARTHHERWDGGGYPRGLVTTEIPVAGRIVAVADVFDALTTERPYKRAWTVEEAVSEMRGQSGLQFDPEIIERLLTLIGSNQASLAPLLSPRRQPAAASALLPALPSADASAMSAAANAQGAAQQRLEAQELLDRAWGLRKTDPRAGGELAQRGMALARQSGDELLLGQARRNVGFYHYLAGEYEDALTQLAQGMDLGILCADPALQADCANFTAAVYNSLSDYGKATDHLAVLLRIVREAHDQTREAHCLHNLATISYANRDLPKAQQFAEQSLDLYRALEDIGGQAQAMSTRANIALDLNQPELAAQAAQAAAELAKAAGNVSVTNIALGFAGQAAARLGDPEAGKALLRTAIDSDQAAQLAGHEAWHRFELGHVHQGLGELAEARECYDRALALAQKLAIRDLELQICLRLSEVCAQEGRHQEAFELYRQHHDVEREIHNQTAALKTRALMSQLEVERAKSEAQIYRLKTIELANANEALERVNNEKSGLVNMLEEQSRLLERQLSEDGLTGLFNRKHVEGLLQHEFLKSRSTPSPASPLCAAMADIDHFKQINDQFSHLIGDQVLRTVSRLFRSAVRPTDGIGRYGGEEFLFVFPSTSIEQGQRICQRVLELVRDYDWSQIHPRLSVTLSIGVACDPGVSNHERLISLADEQLYRAKNTGRNRLCAAGT